MSSESSFDAQVFNEFDDFVPKPHSTDSDCIPSDPDSDSPHAAISSQGPPLPINILPSSQTSIPPATPGISESFCKLDIASQDTDSLTSRRRRGRPFKRIYARRHALGNANTKEDALVKPADYITKMSKPRGHKFSKPIPVEDIALNSVFLYVTILYRWNLQHLRAILRGSFPNQRV